MQLKFLIISWGMLILLLIVSTTYVFRNPQRTSQLALSLTRTLQNNIQLVAISLAALLIILIGVNSTQSGSFLFESFVNSLPRLLPIIWFMVVVSGQMLILLILVKLSPRWAILLLWSFGFTFIASSLIHESYRSYRLYFFLFPLISLVGDHIWARLTQNLRKIKLPNRSRKVLFVGILLILIGGATYAYHSAANVRATEINPDYTTIDQRAHLRFAKKVYLSNFKYTGDRGRMPVYPFLLALFFDPSLSDAEYFSKGKIVSINLSIVLLLLLYMIAQNLLAVRPAVLLTLIIAFTQFIFRAGYFHAWLLYYFMLFGSFILMTLMIIRPSIKLGITTGIVVGLTHLTKASVLPGLALFVAVFLLKETVHWYRRQRHKPAENGISVGTFRKRVFSGLVAVVAFLIVIFPYIRESKIIYGQYFYNVNQNFFPWYDSWEQAKLDPIYRVIYQRAPDLPADELPSPQKYLREHTFLQIFERMRDGIQHQFNLITHQFSLFNYSYLLLFSLCFLTVFNLRGAYELLREHKYPILFSAFFISGYLLLFAWYTAISRGSRFLFSLQAVFLFMMFVGIRVFDQKFPNIIIFGESFNTSFLVNFVYTNLTLFVLVDTYFVLADLLYLPRVVL